MKDVVSEREKNTLMDGLHPAPFEPLLLSGKTTGNEVQQKKNYVPRECSLSNFYPFFSRRQWFSLNKEF